MAHVPSPWRLLASALTDRRRSLARLEVSVDCGGTRHRLRFDGRRFFAPDHDEVGEAALRALGGVEPMCVRVIAATDAATTAQWWASLDPRAQASLELHQALRQLPEPVRRILLASALDAEFADAATAVRDSAAQLGLAVVGDGPLAVDTLRTKFASTREFPRFDPGPGPWSDQELVLLNRCMRSGAGEARPHLVLLPADPLTRQAVAKYAAGLLDAERFLTPTDLRTALSSTHRNVKALTALLVAEGVLEARDGQYRVRTPAKAARSRRR